MTAPSTLNTAHLFQGQARSYPSLNIFCVPCGDVSKTKDNAGTSICKQFRGRSPPRNQWLFNKGFCEGHVPFSEILDKRPKATQRSLRVCLWHSLGCSYLTTATPGEVNRPVWEKAERKHVQSKSTGDNSVRLTI